MALGMGRGAGTNPPGIFRDDCIWPMSRLLARRTFVHNQHKYGFTMVTDDFTYIFTYIFIL